MRSALTLKRERRRFGSQRVFSFLDFICMIKGEYPALLNERTGQWILCSSKDEMAEILGVNVRTIYRYLEEKKSPPGYTLIKKKARAFLVMAKDGRLRICKRINDTWVVAGSDKEVIRDEDMAKWMDISDIFYNGKKHERV